MWLIWQPLNSPCPLSISWHFYFSQWPQSFSFPVSNWKSDFPCYDFNLATQVIRFLLLERPPCLSWLSTFPVLALKILCLGNLLSPRKTGWLATLPSICERAALVSEAHLKRRRAGSPGVQLSFSSWDSFSERGVWVGSSMINLSS